MFDASALLSAVGPGAEGAGGAWLRAVESGRVEASAPDLVFAELANGLRGYVRAGVLDEVRAGALLEEMTTLPLRTVPLRTLAAPALATALRVGLTAYDACYLVLAEQAEATLVTADRKLAAAARDAALLPGATPP